MGDLKAAKASGSLRAINIVDFDAFKKHRHPGSYHVVPGDTRGEWFFWYCCPCGCGLIAPITVGANFKPPQRPSWNWNVSTTEPTLTPSVHHKGHWHGWLTDGYWRSV